MRVPRPFEPDPEEIEQPQGKEYKKHVEREEKPLADENQQQSEDFHGGNESTESLPDSPNESIEEQQEEQQNDNSQQSQNNNVGNSQQGSNGEQSQQSNGSSSSENQNSSDKQNSENSSQGESQQTQNSSEGQQSSSNESSTSNASESQQSSGKTESSESNEQSSGEQSEEQSSGQSSDPTETDNEQEESDSTSQESNGETSDSSSDLSDESDTDDGTSDSEEQSGETSESEEEEQKVSDSSEESEVQVNSGTYNTDQVFTYTSAKNNTKLSRALYDFIEYIADETRVFNNLSADYYEPKKLMLRRYQGKSLNATKSGKVRETIVVLLDNSGSMDWVREHVLETARALIQRHDAEIYFTPNGYVETQLTKQGEEQVKHENVINKIVSQQLKVLYLGDYDGANTPIELSWKTKVFWLCPESRYRRFRSHDWVSYDESDFRGFFARTYNANEMVQALKRFAGFAQFTRYWYDPHEREVFQDD